MENEAHGILFLLGFLFAYFLPAIIGYARGHRSAHAILAVTLILGWLGIGWLWGLIWSLTGNVRSEAVTVSNR